jgi:hypothetical protein
MIGNTECTVAEEELLQGGVVAEDGQGPVDDDTSRPVQGRRVRQGLISRSVSITY